MAPYTAKHSRLKNRTHLIASYFEARNILFLLDDLKLSNLWQSQIAHIHTFVSTVQSANRIKWTNWQFNKAKASRFYFTLLSNIPPAQLKPADNLLLTMDDKFKSVLTSFSTLACHFDILIGAWHNTPCHLWLNCQCADVIDDELHLFSFCPSLHKLREVIFFTSHLCVPYLL